MEDFTCKESEVPFGYKTHQYQISLDRWRILDSHRRSIFEDNQGTISLVEKPKFHSRSKYINNKYHYIREAVENKKTQLEYYRSEEITAVSLTQNLSRTWCYEVDLIWFNSIYRKQWQYCVRQVGVVEIYDLHII